MSSLRKRSHKDSSVATSANKKIKVEEEETVQEIPEAETEEELHICCFCAEKGTDDDLFHCRAEGCKNWFCEDWCEKESTACYNTETAKHFCCNECKKKHSLAEKGKNSVASTSSEAKDTKKTISRETPFVYVLGENGGTWLTKTKEKHECHFGVFAEIYDWCEKETDIHFVVKKHEVYECYEKDPEFNTKMAVPICVPCWKKETRTGRKNKDLEIDKNVIVKRMKNKGVPYFQ